MADLLEQYIKEQVKKNRRWGKRKNRSKAHGNGWAFEVC